MVCSRYDDSTLIMDRIYNKPCILTYRRRMEELVKGFGLDSLSASEVSRICKILDEKVEEFLKKPIETKIRYLLVDATYSKVR